MLFRTYFSFKHSFYFLILRRNKPNGASHSIGLYDYLTSTWFYVLTTSHRSSVHIIKKYDVTELVSLSLSIKSNYQSISRLPPLCFNIKFFNLPAAVRLDSSQIQRFSNHLMILPIFFISIGITLLLIHSFL